MDEMKIQSNLVFDKYSGDVIGFIDIGDSKNSKILKIFKRKLPV